jgi:hypothetical protein
LAGPSSPREENFPSTTNDICHVLQHSVELVDFPRDRRQGGMLPRCFGSSMSARQLEMPSPVAPLTAATAILI